MNQFELPEYIEVINTLHDWFKKGYINKDAPTRGDVNDIMKSQKAAVSFDPAYYEGKEAELKPAWNNAELVAVPMGEAFVTAGSILKTINAVSVTSKNPELALMLLELSNTQEFVLNIGCRNRREAL